MKVSIQPSATNSLPFEQELVLRDLRRIKSMYRKKNDLGKGEYIFIIYEIANG